MISAILFALHFIFLIYIFFKKRKEEDLASAFQNSILIIILFTVGWSVVTMVTKLFIPIEGLGKHLDRDTITLLILAMFEIIFYKKYYFKSIVDDKEKQL